MDADTWLSLLAGLVGALLGGSATSYVAFRQIRRSTDRAVERLSDLVVRENQSWYWTAEWQAGEVEADADLAAGRTTVLSSDQDLDQFLASRPSRSTT